MIASSLVTSWQVGIMASAIGRAATAGNTRLFLGFIPGSHCELLAHGRRFQATAMQVLADLCHHRNQ